MKFKLIFRSNNFWESETDETLELLREKIAFCKKKDIFFIFGNILINPNEIEAIEKKNDDKAEERA